MHGGSRAKRQLEPWLFTYTTRWLRTSATWHSFLARELLVEVPPERPVEAHNRPQLFKDVHVDPAHSSGMRRLTSTITNLRSGRSSILGLDLKRVLDEDQALPHKVVASQTRIAHIGIGLSHLGALSCSARRSEASGHEAYALNSQCSVTEGTCRGQVRFTIRDDPCRCLLARPRPDACTDALSMRCTRAPLLLLAPLRSRQV